MFDIEAPILSRMDVKNTEYEYQFLSTYSISWTKHQYLGSFQSQIAACNEDKKTASVIQMAPQITYRVLLLCKEYAYYLLYGVCFLGYLILNWFMTYWLTCQFREYLPETQLSSLQLLFPSMRAHTTFIPYKKHHVIQFTGAPLDLLYARKLNRLLS